MSDMLSDYEDTPSNPYLDTPFDIPLECEDCKQATLEVWHYDKEDGCHEVCPRCAIRRGFKVNPSE